MGLLAHWAHYLFHWASPTDLPHLYLLFFLWASWLLFLPCWPIGLATSFLELSRPIYFIFTSYSSHGLASCYSCHVGPLGLLPLFLGFLAPLISSLPLILLMGLLTVIPAMLAHWTCYLFSWASLAHLLYLYLSFFPWACWLLFLPCWLIGFTNLLLPFLFLFLSISLIVGLLLLLSLSLKK